MAIGAVVGAAAKGAAGGSSSGIGQLIFGTASAGASGGNQNTEDPFAGGILSRIGGWTADPQSFFSLPRKIRNAKRNEQAQDNQLEIQKAQLEAMNLVNTEERRKQEWSRNVRKLMLRGGR